MGEADVWTEEKCIRLIREFKLRTLLWCPKNPRFYKKTLKPHAWEEIAKNMNTPSEECKHKMSILMSSFRREKSKVRNSLKTCNDSSSFLYISSWFAFKEMSFLMDRFKVRKRQKTNSNSEENEDETASRLEDSIQKHRVQLTENQRAKSLRKITKYNNNTQSTTIERLDNSKSEPGLAQGPSQTSEERDEEISSFIAFIGSKMKRYSEVTRNEVQREICRIIFNADKDLYEANYTNSIINDDNEDNLLNTTFNADQIKIETEDCLEID